MGRYLPLSISHARIKATPGKTVLGHMLLAVVCFGVGCSLAPSMTFHTQAAEDDKGRIKFYLSSTDIVLTKSDPNDKKGDVRNARVSEGEKIEIDRKDNIGAILEDQVRIILTPKEDRRTLYAVVPESRWLGAVKTNLSVTYYDTNDTSFLVKTVGSEVQDDRVKIISSIGAVAVAAAAMAAYAPPPKVVLRLPVAIDTIEGKDGKWRALPKNPEWFYKLRVSPERGASISKDSFFSKHADCATSAFPFSTCRKATLHVKLKPDNTPPLEADDGDAKFHIMFADSDYLDTLALPPKGSLKFHSICGANIVTEKVEGGATWDLLESLMNQAKNVKDKLK